MGEKRIKVRTVLRRVGVGNITFWSVMPYSKIKNGVQRMYTDGIEDEQQKYRPKAVPLLCLPSALEVLS